MSAFESFPLGQPGFVNNILDRAAHLRTKDDKLMAMESDPRSRAYVVHRDSLVVRKDGETTRALLSIDEALKCGANPGTIFLGLRDGAAVFGMGISQAAAEGLMNRNDVELADLRAMAQQGVVPPNELSAIAMAKSMVNWHQRHAYCANCGQRTAMKEGGWKRDCPSCKAEHVFVPGRVRRSRRNHRGCGPPRGVRGGWNPLHRCRLLHDAALALSVVADDRLRRARIERRHRGRPLGAGRCTLVRPRRGAA